MNINNYIKKILIFIVLLIFISYIYLTDGYFIRKLLPLKNVSNKPIKKIMIGCPTIDRDIKKAPKMYEKMRESITHLSNNNNVETNIIIITRETDYKMIKFWNDKANKIILVPDYNINLRDRHNLNAISLKMNILSQYCLDNNYDALVIIESDVYSNIDTLTNLINCLYDNHVSFAYGNIPWKNEPIIVMPGIFKPKIIYPKEKKLWKQAHGSWTGCVAIRKEVLHNKPFINKKFQDIVGQDVGFYIKCFHNRFRVFVTDYIEHDYK